MNNKMDISIGIIKYESNDEEGTFQIKGKIYYKKEGIFYNTIFDFICLNDTVPDEWVILWEKRDKFEDNILEKFENIIKKNIEKIMPQVKFAEIKI